MLYYPPRSIKPFLKYVGENMFFHSSDSRRERRNYAIAFGLLILITLCLYSSVRNFSFLNLDDGEYVTSNPFVVTGNFVDNVRWVFTHYHAGYWHPVTWISHMIDARLFGLDPGPHHLMNVAIHALNVALFFTFLYLATGRAELAFWIAAIFGVHPMRLEAVSWVSERKELLSAFFGMLTLNGYLLYGKSRQKWAYLLALAFFALGLMAKPTLVTFPFLLLLLDYWPLNRISLVGSPQDNFRRLFSLLIEKLPFFLFSFFIAVMTMRSQEAGGGLRSFAEISMADRFSTAWISYLAYFAKLIWPTGFGIFYPALQYPPGAGAGAFLGFLALTFVFLRRAVRYPSLAVGWLWFVVVLLPMAGFVAVGGQSLADRWTYLPHLGLLVGLAGFLSTRRDLIRHAIALRISLCLAVMVFASITFSQLPYWQDSISLFSHTLAVYPQNFMAHTNLGVALDQTGKLDEAIPHYEEAVRLNPTYPEALNNLGTARARQGNFAEARSLFERAISRRPEFTQAHYHLGLTEYQLGDPIGAMSEWVTTLEIEPQNEAARKSIEFAMVRNFAVPCEQWNPPPRVTLNSEKIIQLREANLSWNSTEPFRQGITNLIACLK